MEFVAADVERFLVLSVNSASRAAKGTTLLENVLGKMVCPPLTTIQTIEQMKASRKRHKPSPDDIPVEVATPLVHAMLDKQYREILDEPVGIIGNIAPRAAVRTKKGRERSPSGSNISKPGPQVSIIHRIRWQATTSAGCGVNSTSKTFADEPRNTLRRAL